MATVAALQSLPTELYWLCDAVLEYLRDCQWTLAEQLGAHTARRIQPPYSPPPWLYICATITTASVLTNVDGRWSLYLVATLFGWPFFATLVSRYEDTWLIDYFCDGGWSLPTIMLCGVLVLAASTIVQWLVLAEVRSQIASWQALATVRAPKEPPSIETVYPLAMGGYWLPYHHTN